MADAKIINYGQPIGAGSTAIPDNTSTALDIESTDANAEDYITIDTTEGSENMKFGVGASSDMMRFFANGTIDTSQANGYGIQAKTTASATAPVFIPNKNDPDTGIGRADADQLSLVAGGVEGVRITKAGGVAVVKISNGTAAAPSLHFAAADDTGFYSPAAGQIGATVDAGDAQGGRVLHLEGTEDTPGGKNNVAVGPDSLKNLLDLADQSSRGSFNVGLGGFANNKITTGSANLAIGRGSMWNARTSSSNNVGIGDGIKSNNTAIGYQSGTAVTTGGTNTMIGYQAADAVTTTGTGTYIGASTAASAATGVSNETCLGYAAVGNGSNTVTLGNDTVGELRCEVTSITGISDQRVKNNVQDSSVGLDFINALRPVKYEKKHPSDYPEEIREERWSERTKTNISDTGEVTEYTVPADEKPSDWQPKTEYGLIAQEVKAAMESHNATDWQGHTITPNGTEALGYSSLVIVLVKAVQELTARVAELEAGD